MSQLIKGNFGKSFIWNWSSVTFDPEGIKPFDQMTTKCRSFVAGSDVMAPQMSTILLWFGFLSASVISSSENTLLEVFVLLSTTWKSLYYLIKY